VRKESAEARSFGLGPERGEIELYRYMLGQFPTFRVPHDGGELIRSYPFDV
jgi:ferredoxin-NADP reductase